MRRKSIHRALAVAVLAVGLGTVTSAGEAHWQRVNWSHSSSTDCQSGNLTDPIGMVFYGYPAMAGIVHDDITYHGYVLTGQDWSHDDEPSPFWNTKQWVWDHGLNRCVENQRANANQGVSWNGVQPRYHIRLWQMSHLDDKGRHETVATPHFETPCDGATFKTNHGVISFDAGREEYRRMFDTNYHTIKHAYWGNSHTVKECGQWYVRSTGDVEWVYFPKRAESYL